MAANRFFNASKTRTPAVYRCWRCACGASGRCVSGPARTGAMRGHRARCAVSDFDVFSESIPSDELAFIIRHGYRRRHADGVYRWRCAHCLVEMGHRAPSNRTETIRRHVARCVSRPVRVSKWRSDKPELAPTAYVVRGVSA